MTERINKIAKRIIDVSDMYELWDSFGTDEADQIDGITDAIVNDPLSVIETLVDMIEELQAEV